MGASVQGVHPRGHEIPSWMLSVTVAPPQASTRAIARPVRPCGKLKKGSLQIKKRNLEAKQSRVPRICVEGKLPPNVFKATHMRRSKAYAWKKNSSPA
ncbi:hypothetical protein PIB30_071859 [Stylosanthes scabra]|uniref:Uncharacterized protein n=1 Tax=Stylosanthes scabra TaxID=79078 RepID=A0ABU6XQ74_9FABA|nr:hypothetical protein [Stylosanthes scabra]